MSEIGMSEQKNSWLLISSTVLRIAIGWHFLYEGLLKVVNSDWSAAYYLSNSSGPFSSFFQGLEANASMLATIDFLNQWGLTLIGISLIVGLFSRWASLAGILILSLYYLSNPPFIGNAGAASLQGHYMIVNMHLIEIVALWILFIIQDSKVYGLDSFFSKRASKSLSF